MGVGAQRHASGALPQGKTRYPFYRRLSGPQGRSERVRRILTPHRDSVPGPSSPLRVAIPIDLSRLLYSCTIRPKIEYGFRTSVMSLCIRRVASKNDYELCLASLPVCPHGTTRFPLDGFSWNLIFEHWNLEVKLGYWIKERNNV